MNVTPFLPIIVPLAGAALSLGLGTWPRVQRALGIVALTATVAINVLLLAQVGDGSMLVAGFGGWEAPVGITLVIDTFSAIMLVVSSVMLLAVLVYAIGSPRTTDEVTFFHPVYLVLAAGVSASFLTGDLFNLFVAFEITLVASYVLITLGGSRAQVRHGMTYVVISLLASTLFISGVALVYAATGTVNMADLAVRLGEIDPGLRSTLGILFLVVFGIKAAIFPLFFWLPDSYPTAPRRSRPSSPGYSPRWASTPSSAPKPCCSPTGTLHVAPRGGRAHHGGRSTGGHRPGRRQADPELPHHQPDRLHDLRPRALHRGGARRHRVLRGPSHPRSRPCCSWSAASSRRPRELASYADSGGWSTPHPLLAVLFSFRP
jgi:hypothetical protein